MIQAIGLLLLTRLFEPSIFGRLASAGTLAILIGLLPTLGSGFILMARAPRDPAAATDVWRYAWPMTIVLGFVLTLAYLPLTRVIMGTQSLPMNVLTLLAVTEILAMPLIGLASFALQSRERVPLSQMLQALPFALRVVALLPCFYVAGDFRLPAYALSQCLATVVALTICLAVTRRHFETRGRIRLPTRSEFSEGATYASMQMVAANATELDKVLAIRLIGPHDAGLYSIAGRVLIALLMPINAMLLAVQPRLFGHAHSPSKSGHRLISVAGLAATAWGACAALLLLMFSAIVPMVFGTGYAASSQIMQWMAIIAPLMGLRVAVGSVLVALGRPLDRLALEFAGILVMLCVLLSFSSAFGAAGIVFGVGLAEATMLVIGVTMVLTRIRAEVSAWEH